MQSDADVMASPCRCTTTNAGSVFCVVLALARATARPGRAPSSQGSTCDPFKGRLDMPCSGKGGGRDRAEQTKKRYTESIAPALGIEAKCCS